MIRLIPQIKGVSSEVPVVIVGGSKFSWGELLKLHKDSARVFKFECSNCGAAGCGSERVFVSLRPWGDALLLKEVAPDDS